MTAGQTGGHITSALVIAIAAMLAVSVAVGAPVVPGLAALATAGGLALWPGGRARQADSRAVGAGLLAGSVASALALVLLRVPQTSDFGEYLRLARNLSANGTYEDRGMYAWRPPGMALALGLPLAAGVGANAAVWIVNAASVWGLWRAGAWMKAWRLPAPAWLVGLSAAALVWPLMMVPASETPAVALAAGSAAAVAVTRAEMAAVSRRRLAFGGACLGLATLFRPQLAVAVPVVAVAVARARGAVTPGGAVRSIGAGFAHAVPFVLAAILVVTPWTLRNAVVLRAFVPISTNGGEVFFASNAASGDRQGAYNEELYARLRRAEPGEAARSTRGFVLGLAHIASVPGTFIGALPSRAARILEGAPFWAGDHVVMNQDRTPQRKRLLHAWRFVAGVAFWSLLIAAARGAYAARRHNPDRVRWPHVCLAAVFAVSLLFEAAPRYALVLVPYALAAWGSARTVAHTRVTFATDARVVA